MAIVLMANLAKAKVKLGPRSIWGTLVMTITSLLNNRIRSCSGSVGGSHDNLWRSFKGDTVKGIRFAEVEKVEI